MFTITAGCSLIINAVLFHKLPGFYLIVLGADLFTRHSPFVLQTRVGEEAQGTGELPTLGTLTLGSFGEIVPLMGISRAIRGKDLTKEGFENQLCRGLVKSE